MIRKALIIYCDNSPSGKLPGTAIDFSNYNSFLLSSLGGDWKTNEILSLKNPTCAEVKTYVSVYLSGADYTFIIFAGHGCIDTKTNQQHIELLDGDLSIISLRTNALRQTTIIDSCRGYHEFAKSLTKLFSESTRSWKGSTRSLFDNAVQSAEQGWSIMYSASPNESAGENATTGGDYLYALLKVAEAWEKSYIKDTVLKINEAHDLAKVYMKNNFLTVQNPVMEGERRKNYFPFAVKLIAIYS